MIIIRGSMAHNKPEGIEQRITRRLLSYWDANKSDAELPLASNINRDDLQDVWDDCFLVEVKGSEDKGFEFRYNYIGSSIIAAYGDEVTGADIQTSLLSPEGKHVMDIFEEVVEMKTPVIDEAEFTNLQHVVVRYRQCILPFSDKNGKVTHLLGGMRWGAF